MKPNENDALEERGLPPGAFAALRTLFGGQWGRLSLAAVAYVVKHSPVWIAPITSAAIINAASRGGSGALEESFLYAGAQAALILLNIPMNSLYVRTLNGSVRAMEARARMALVRRLQLLAFSYHDRTRTGALQNKVLRDVESVGTMVAQFINTILATLVGVALALAWTVSRKPVMALFFLATVPVAVGLIWAFRRPIGSNTQRYRKALEGMSVRIAEMLSMLPVTRAHAAEDFEIHRIGDAMEEVAATGRRLDVFNGLFSASSWAMFQLFSLASLSVSCVLAFRGEIPIGDVILYQGFFMSITGGVSAVVNVLPELTKGVNAIGSIGEVLRASDLEQNAGKRRLPEVAGRFSFQRVSFSYPGGAQVLRGIDLEIDAGETVAFVGESGSGKSTIMNLLIGFHRPSGGRILLDGVDTAELDLRDFRRRLSLVGQNVILFSGTIRDNVGYGRADIDDERIREALEAANAWGFVRDLPDGLDTVLGENGSRLSGGQRQRLAIARALIRDPRVIILDEATSALDAESERQVQEAIDRLARGRTTLIVAHRLSTIRNADKIVVLRRGEVAECGSHDELLSRGGEFAKLYRTYR